MSISRLYDFAPSTIIYSGQVDSELDQLVAEVNKMVKKDGSEAFTGKLTGDLAIAGDLKLDLNKRLYLDGGSDTGIFASDVVDPNNLYFRSGGVDLVAFGNGDEMWSFDSLNADAEFYINHRGYASGFTRKRTTKIGDGQDNVVATFSGVDGTLEVPLGMRSGVSADAIKWKILSGTTNGSGTVSFTHGLTSSTIKGVIGHIESSTGNAVFYESSYSHGLSWDDTVVWMRMASSTYYTKPAKVIVFYV